MDAQTTMEIANAIKVMTNALDSADTRELKKEHVAQFEDIKQKFSHCLSTVNIYCLDNEPIFQYVKDSMDVRPVEELLNYLVCNEFAEMVVAAKEIAKCTFDLCKQIKEFIKVLQDSYSRSVLFNWSFIFTLLGVAAGIGLIAAACTVPGAQLLLVGGISLVVGGTARTVAKIADHKANQTIDKKLEELETTLIEIQKFMKELANTSGDHAAKMKLVAQVIKLPNGKEKEYLEQMCLSFKALHGALNYALELHPKETLLERFGTATMGVGAATSTVVIASCAVKNPEVIEHVATAASCIIM